MTASETEPRPEPPREPDPLGQPEPPREGVEGFDWNVQVGRVSGRWDHACLKVQPHCATPGRFAPGARLCAVIGERRQLLNVVESRRGGKFFILECALTTAQADALTGAGLFIHPSMRPPLKEGEFYLDQLLGLRIHTEAGEQLGEIEEVLETPVHDVYVTPLALVPGRPEFVVRIDWEAGVMVVRDIPGLRIDAKAG